MRGRARGFRVAGAWRSSVLFFLAAFLLLVSPAAAGGIDLDLERPYGDVLLLYGKGLGTRALV